jgi:proline-rich protein PRCC
MLGVEDYGSDSDNEYPPNASTPAKETHDLPFKQPAPVKPAKTGSNASIMAKRPAKKITIGLPTLPAEPEDEIDAGRPPVKKQRLNSGAGSSSLLSMLPAPKQKDPVAPPPERVLGAGRRPGLVFDNPRSIKTSALPLVDNTAGEDVDDSVDPRDTLEVESTTLFRPTSLKRANISVEERSEPPKKVPPKVPSQPPTNFFSLGSFILLGCFSFT